ncbi:uncharacterized protein LOC135387106 isoform X2 [Ornithodoros turicata]|uniref:uncharacterized protein LOC135387106 isoform X2 n=1 Tax=Ornithodoros turicata TaxID=34597 RepID=UPI00313A3AE6
MDGLRPPDALVLSGNVAENWRKFQQRLEFYLEATEVEGKARSDKKKIATLLHVAGPEAVEVFNTFTLTSGERESYTTVLQRFEDYCTTKCNETYERYVFRCRMQGEDDETDSDGLDVLEVCNGRDNRDDWLITAAISGKDVQLKVDTGSQANLLPLSVFKKIVLGIRTRPTTAVLRSYSGGVISHIGTAQLHTKIKGVTANLDSLTTSARRAILGLKACRLYGLVNCVDAVASTDCSNGHVAADFPDLFQGLGCTKRVYRMVLKEGTVPVIQSARRVPQMLKRPLKEELDRMEAKGIIAKMEEPSDWDF